MNLRHLLVAVALLSPAASTLAPAQQPRPQDRPSVTSNPKVDAHDKTYPLEQILTATVHDAWILSGKNEDNFFDIVEQLAQFSASKRGITLPNTQAAGQRMGERIKARAKADHDALLYEIVDGVVRSSGIKTVAAK